MAKFTTRVELHGADPENYDELHEAMKKESFTRTIIDDNKIEYYLPTAEYNKIGNYTGEDVRNSAKTAASTTGKKYSILVTEGSRTWYNLDWVK